MQKVLPIYKPLILTPNQLIERLRQQHPEYKDEKIGFAGRLDPMAKGVMLLLIGEENKNREKYLNLNKTYQFTALLGLETDSYDLLGILKTSNHPKFPNHPDLPKINQFLTENLGKHTQPYPPFSTKPVQGKELFKWAREGKLSEIEIPTKEIKIFSLKLIKQNKISIADLKDLVDERIPKIQGYFRQEEILKKWSDFFANTTQQEFITLDFEVFCSSGTYVRSIVQNLGKFLGCGAVTLEINRTKVGSFTLDDCLVLSC